MKKFVQGLIITAGAFIVVGIGLSAAGRLMGGEPGFWVRKDGLCTNQDIKKEKAGRTVVLEKTELEAFTGMNIRVDNNNIVVKPSEDDRYYLEYRLYIQKNEPEYEVKDGVLTVTCKMEQNDSVLSGGAGFFVIDYIPGHETGQATVYVPKDSPMNLVKLSSSDGDVSYDGPKAKTLDLTSNYGGIYLKNQAAENAVFTLLDGGLKCDGGSFSGLTVTNKYGNTELNQITASSIDVKIAEGHLTVKDTDTGSFSAKNQYGTTVCDTITADSVTIMQSDGACTIKNADIKDGRFENKYGNVNLDLTGSEKNYNFDLKMKYGEITINGQKFEEQNVLKDNGAGKNITTISSDGNVRIQTE